MRRLYEARDPLDAQMLRDHLAAHHIESVVLGELLSGGAGELSALNFPSVWVVENGDLARAGQLLAEYLEDAERNAEGLPWTCAHCGAEVDAGFDLCWQCGKARADR